MCAWPLGIEAETHEQILQTQPVWASAQLLCRHTCACCVWLWVLKPQNPLSVPRLYVVQIAYSAQSFPLLLQMWLTSRP